jgi:tetratricopeptide (TPR) repeat protein
VEGAEQELFDLSRDPAESENLAAREPRRLQQMRAGLRAVVREMAPEGDTAQARRATPEQEERLRSLGYVGGGGGTGALDEPGLPDPRRRAHVYDRMQQAMLAQGPGVEAALADMTAIVAEDPGNPFAHMARAHLAYRDGRMGTAARAFARTLELDPERPAVRLPYGRLLREMGRLEESERQLRIAVEQAAPDDVRTPLGLAETLHAAGKLQEAERVVDAVLARAASDPPALAAKARLLVEQGRDSEAAGYLERARAGAELDDWIALGEAYLRRGLPDRARESVEHALAESPRHPWALAVAGHALVLGGRREPGLALLQRALALHPRRPHVWLRLAEALAAAGDQAAAARCRREAQAALQA